METDSHGPNEAGIVIIHLGAEPSQKEVLNGESNGKATKSKVLVNS